MRNKKKLMISQIDVILLSVGVRKKKGKPFAQLPFNQVFVGFNF
jgi:hypothetical protein